MGAEDVSMTRNRFLRPSNSTRRSPLRGRWWMSPTDTPSEQAITSLDLPAGTRR